MRYRQINLAIKAKIDITARTTAISFTSCGVLSGELKASIASPSFLGIIVFKNVAINTRTSPVI